MPFVMLTKERRIAGFKAVGPGTSIHPPIYNIEAIPLHNAFIIFTMYPNVMPSHYIAFYDTTQCTKEKKESLSINSAMISL